MYQTGFGQVSGEIQKKKHGKHILVTGVRACFLFLCGDF